VSLAVNDLLAGTKQSQLLYEGKENLFEGIPSAQNILQIEWIISNSIRVLLIAITSMELYVSP
jgi:hypothetical protein